ncbi:MAG: BrnT family toxin [bacterium]
MYYFEWDSQKAVMNLRKHGVSFEEVSTVFGDPFSMNMPDPDHSITEDRYLLLGVSQRKRCLVVSYVERETKPA